MGPASAIRADYRHADILTTPKALSGRHDGPWGCKAASAKLPRALQVDNYHAIMGTVLPRLLLSRRAVLNKALQITRAILN